MPISIQDIANGTPSLYQTGDFNGIHTHPYVVAGLRVKKNGNVYCTAIHVICKTRVGVAVFFLSFPIDLKAKSVMAC